MYGRKVTVISDNKRLLKFFEMELLSMGACVSTSKNLLAGSSECELLIIDIDTVRAVSDTYGCPVIRVSENEINDKNAILWPVCITEFTEKCNSILKDTVKEVSEETVDTLYVLDNENGIVMLDNVQIRLSRTELAVMDELCANCGKTVTRQRLMDIIGAKTGNISDVYICMLRKKIEALFGKRLIFTERSKGYYTYLRMVK